MIPSLAGRVPLTMFISAFIEMVDEAW